MKKILSVFAICITMAMILSLEGCSAAPEKKEEPTVAAEQTYAERLQSCKKQIEAITDFKPDAVLVLGTGLGDFADTLDVKKKIAYKDIDGWPVSTAPNHAGNLIFAEYNGLKLAVMQGRVHYYEGYSMQEVVLPMRVLHLLGAKTAIITNAVGSMNPEFKVGEFVCLNDQITSFVPSPLVGKNDEDLGERFIGMTDVFDKDMQNTVLNIGKNKGIPVHSGVFVQVSGPQFETPAEIKMYRSLGADTVGMSTGAEVIAARHMGMKVCVINAVSNMAAGMEEDGFSQDSIEDNMDTVSDSFKTLINGLLDDLSE